MIASSTINPICQSSAQVMAFHYCDSRVLLPLAVNFQEARKVAERYFEINGQPYWFEVDDLDICKGERMVVTDAVWHSVVQALGHVYITVDPVKEGAEDVRDKRLKCSPEHHIEDSASDTSLISYGTQDTIADTEQHIPKDGHITDLMIMSPIAAEIHKHIDGAVVSPNCDTPVNPLLKEQNGNSTNNSRNGDCTVLVGKRACDGNKNLDPSDSCFEVNKAELKEHDTTHDKQALKETFKTDPQGLLTRTSTPILNIQESQCENGVRPFIPMYRSPSPIREWYHNDRFQDTETPKASMMQRSLARSFQVQDAATPARPRKTSPTPRHRMRQRNDSLSSSSSRSDVEAELPCISATVTRPSTGERAVFQIRSYHKVRKLLKRVCSEFDIQDQSLVMLRWIKLNRSSLQVGDKVDCEPERTFGSIGVLPGAASFELEISRPSRNPQERKDMQLLQEQGIASNFSRLSLVSPISPKNY